MASGAGSVLPRCWTCKAPCTLNARRRACAVLGQHRSMQRKPLLLPDDEAALTADIVALARRFGRYGYRRITALLRRAGWVANVKWVEWIWRREGLKVPQREPKRGRPWLVDGSCIRLRPERANHVWAYRFVEDRTHDARKFGMLTVIDDFTRQSLAIVVARSLSSDDVPAALTELFVERGPSEHIRSDQGPEFIALIVKEWLIRLGVMTLYIETAGPCENEYNESFNGKLRDELLNPEISYSPAEARALIEAWRRHYSTERPCSSLGFRPPAPEAISPPRWPSGFAARRRPPSVAEDAAIH